MSQAETLFQLQQIELAIARNQKRLKEIAAELDNNAVVVQARSVVESAQKTLTPLHKQIRDLDLQMQTNTTKTQTAEQRLYGGMVKNPKELQDLQQEIASLKKWRGELENRMLDLMVQAEEAEVTLDEAQSQLAEITQRWASEHQELLQEKVGLENEVADLKRQRQAALGNVDANSLKLYNEMKARKANQPVSQMKNRVCSICGIEQTPLIEQEVRRRDKLVYCQNCGRILVYTL